MIKHIYQQLWVNRRSTGWIFAELLMVFCLVWYVMDFFFSITYNYSLKNYQDTSGTWLVEMKEFEENNGYYSSLDRVDEKRYNHFVRIADGLKNIEEINEVALVFSGYSIPGTGSNYGISLVSADDTTCTFNGSVISFDPDYDYFGIFRYSKDRGRTKIHTSDFDWSLPGSIVVNQQALIQAGQDITGKMFINDWGQSEEYRVVGVIDETKRIKYERPRNFVYVPSRLTPDLIQSAKIIIRQHPSVSKERFKERFEREIAPGLRSGNFYFAKLVYIPQINADTERTFGVDSTKASRSYILFFFLANIFLCLLGSCWYRVYNRRGEIGLRVALGSTHRGIMKLFIMEVFCLAVLVLPFAFFIEWQLIAFDLVEEYNSKWLDPDYLPDRLFIRFLITNGITFIIILLVAGLSVWLPAYRASKIRPAEALHYE